MQAWQINGDFSIDGLQLNSYPDPAPGPNQVVVGVKAVSFNFRDLLVVKGLYSKKVPQPLTICSDGAGVVLATGGGVSRVKAGDRVAGIFMQTWLSGPPEEAKARSAMGAFFPGVFAQQVVLDQEGGVRVPDHLTDAEAATLPCAGVTSWNALASLKAGESVLVQGSGGVSIFALQFAKASGARVIATTSSEEKAAKLRALGADEVINYSTTPDWEEHVRKLTGTGVDHVVEIGGSATMNKSIRAVKMGGSIYLIGNRASGTAEVNLTAALMKSVRIQGIFVGSREMFEGMNAFLAAHMLKPAVDRVFAFDQAREALRYFDSGAHFGKVCASV